MLTNAISAFYKNPSGVFLKASFLALALAMGGCTPSIVKFRATIPTNSPPPTEAEAVTHQGTTHVCPGTPVQLSWAVKGRASLSATPGLRYQPPECFSYSSLPAEGTKLVATSATQLIGTCGNTAIFRLTASHTIWRPSGGCPGPGCPNDDHEIIMEANRKERIGDTVGECLNGAYEVANTKSAIDWDDRYRVGTVSLAGSVAGALAPGRTLTVSHNGKEATLSTGAPTSDAFRGEKITGDWNLRLSGCASPPPALIINAEVECRK